MAQHRSHQTPTTTAEGHARAAKHRRQHALPHDGQGIVRNENAEEQPADKRRAQHVSGADPGDGAPRATDAPKRPKHE
jgi:hypothetical protein